MYFISGGIGFIACIIFIVLTVIFALRGKPCRTPLIALFLSVLLFLGSGFLYSRTDPNVGGAGFLRYVVRDQTVPPDLWGEWRDFANGESFLWCKCWRISLHWTGYETRYQGCKVP